MGKAMVRAMEFGFYVAFVVWGLCFFYTFATWVPSLKDGVSSTLASWVQAVGAIAAIIGAAWVSNDQIGVNVLIDCIALPTRQ